MLISADPNTGKFGVVYIFGVYWSKAKQPLAGLVKIVDSKGPTLTELQKVRQMWLMFLLLVLLPMLLILLWQGWTWVVELYAVRLQTHWLEDFYRANAPEVKERRSQLFLASSLINWNVLQKLSDPQYVARTIAKYKGRMFLLWRNLEKTYKVYQLLYSNAKMFSFLWTKGKVAGSVRGGRALNAHEESSYEV